MKYEFYDINGRTIEQFTYPAVSKLLGSVDLRELRVEHFEGWDTDRKWDMQYCDVVAIVNAHTHTQSIGMEKCHFVMRIANHIIYFYVKLFSSSIKFPVANKIQFQS